MIDDFFPVYEIHSGAEAYRDCLCNEDFLFIDFIGLRWELSHSRTFQTSTFEPNTMSAIHNQWKEAGTLRTRFSCPILKLTLG